MSTRHRLPAVLLLALLALSGRLPAQETDPKMTKRFALVVGANYGGPTREKLHYAVSDAKAVLQVLEAMGGVAPEDSRLLVEPDRETLLWELGRLRERVERARGQHRRVELLFYYSGHSDDESFFLGRDRLSYQDFRRELDGFRADARIAILDSCASGAFLRTKGGRKQLPFLFDTAYDMRGFAVMTSSSATESSQESDRIRGSFFTHHFIAGLRGAADTSQDGRITLGEVYLYAFRETLSQTEKSVGGPQHPSYNINMTGTGDVVLTDIRQSASILRLESDISGKIFIHTQKDALVMELQKLLGAPLDLGMEQGKYRVITVGEGAILEARVELRPSHTEVLGSAQLKPVEAIDATARGDRQVGLGRTGTTRILPSFFVGLFGKLARYEGHWSFMPGMIFGVRFNRSLSLGLSGFGKTASEEYSRPPFWGISADYAFLEKGALRLSVGSTAGFMYKDREDEISQKLSLVLEPRLGALWSLGAQLKLLAQFSLDFVNGTNDSWRRFSFGLGVMLGK